MVRAVGQPATPKVELYRAVRDKCVDCMGNEQAVERIRDCQAAGVCPLWPVRPYQVKGKG